MGLIDSLKNTKDLVVSVHDAELKTQLLDKLLDANLQASHLLEENRELKDRIRELERLAEYDMVPTTRQVFLNRKDNQLYCPTCWGAQGHPILIVPKPHTRHGICNQCKGHYQNAFIDKKMAE